ncbi:MAG: hypothetical protein IKH42_07635, partial [Lachnospiraceae bacterium]|nr:hypothetical protein [Lachnospiraceae bacterium]
MDEALPFTDFKLEIISRKHNLKDTQGRIDFLKEAVGVIKILSPIERDVYVTRLSES